MHIAQVSSCKVGLLTKTGLECTHRILQYSCRARRNHVCRVWTEIFRGYSFTGSQIFQLIFTRAFEQCSANALPVMRAICHILRGDVDSWTRLVSDIYQVRRVHPSLKFINWPATCPYFIISTPTGNFRLTFQQNQSFVFYYFCSLCYSFLSPFPFFRQVQIHFS